MYFLVYCSCLVLFVVLGVLRRVVVVSRQCTCGSIGGRLLLVLGVGAVGCCFGRGSSVGVALGWKVGCRYAQQELGVVASFLLCLIVVGAFVVLVG